MENKEDTALSGGSSVIRPLLSMICKWGAVMTAVCFAVTLLWGFKFSQLLGFGIGYVSCAGSIIISGGAVRSLSHWTEKPPSGKCAPAMR